VTWYEDALQRVHTVIAANPGTDDATLRKLLSDAYPYGPRKYFPYKKWCEAVNFALTGHRRPKAIARRAAAEEAAQDSGAGLFRKEDSR
jgi:hypothetical protein